MSVTNGMRPVHPGEILGEELEELGMSAHALANALAVPTDRITAILKGQRGITADTALPLSRYFGTTPLQTQSKWPRIVGKHLVRGVGAPAPDHLRPANRDRLNCRQLSSQPL